MMFLVAAVWAVVVTGVIVGVWSLTGGAWRRDTRDRAVKVLRERYARGEINRDEFETRRRDLAA